MQLAITQRPRSSDALIPELKGNRALAHSSRRREWNGFFAGLEVDGSWARQEREDVNVVLAAAGVLGKILLPVCSILQAIYLSRLCAVHEKDILLRRTNANRRLASFVSFYEEFGHLVEGSVREVTVIVNLS